MAPLRPEFIQQMHVLREKHASLGAALDIAYWTIRDAIRIGVIAPGDRLLEVELANALDMSRTPVREALRRLEIERLVENSPRRGLVVPTMSLSDLSEIFDMREVLEGLAARRAAQRSSPTELAAMRDTMERMEQALAAGDTQRLSDTSELFHQLLLASSKLTRLPDFINLLVDLHQASLRLYEFTPDRTAAAVAEHRAIYEAVAAGDADGAEALAREHARNAARAQVMARHLGEF